MTYSDACMLFARPISRHPAMQPSANEATNKLHLVAAGCRDPKTYFSFKHVSPGHSRREDTYPPEFLENGRTIQNTLALLPANTCNFPCSETHIFTFQHPNYYRGHVLLKPSRFLGKDGTTIVAKVSFGRIIDIPSVGVSKSLRTI